MIEIDPCLEIIQFRTRHSSFAEASNNVGSFGILFFVNQEMGIIPQQIDLVGHRAKAIA